MISPPGAYHDDKCVMINTPGAYHNGGVNENFTPALQLTEEWALGILFHGANSKCPFCTLTSLKTKNIFPIQKFF